ncbi:MAG: biosynthetic-type acetolactate synthase large subunit [Clostridia bacterium]|nr:biosynthetic-type acetolactate synthase large subunit [Clostridia bacterium]
MKMTGAQIVVETLIEQGAEVVFGYPGGQVLNLYDELYKNADRIKHVITAHEQGASHAADGYARVTGKVGVCMATSGPGATNLVTGIANAYLDSVPMVAITGNVPNNLIGRDSFQEVDIVGITYSITKHNYIVKDVTKLADTIREAFRIAKSGRPGPVLIDIPKDVQVAETEYEKMPLVEKDAIVKADENLLAKAAELITESERPFIYCGGGAVTSDAGKEIMELAKKIDAPVGFSMMGLTAVPSSFEYSLGMVGMHGHYASSMAMAESDLIIALGVRFSDRATGDKTKYAQNKKIIHIEVDASEINKNINANVGITGDVKDATERLVKLVESSKHTAWLEKLEAYKKYAKENEVAPLGAIGPHQLIDEVCARCDADTPIATDVGQHQMWVAQRYDFKNPRTWASSGGLGTMGFGMGAAIGACVATGKRTVLFTGDGSFGMNLNEMATAVSQKLPLVVVVMNNGVLGMVRQWQTLFYGARYSETTLERKTQFSELAKAFGAEGYAVTNMDELKASLDKAFATEGPVLIDCAIDMDERVLPMIPAGRSVEDLIIK